MAGLDNEQYLRQLQREYLDFLDDDVSIIGVALLVLMHLNRHLRTFVRFPNSAVS